jgi:hypothetical protein
MKILKLKFIFCLILLLPSVGKSQQIANGSFDSLCVCALDRVYHWVTSDIHYLNQDTAQPFAPNAHFTTDNMELHIAMNTVQLNYDNADSLGFAHSVKILSRPGLNYLSGDIFRGFLINGDHFYTDDQGYIDLQRCGVAFPYRPDSISGIYKFEDSLSPSAEYGQAKVLLKKFNAATQSMDTIGYAESYHELSPASQWTRFSMPIHYISSSTPDSIVVAFFSSTSSGRPTTLWLDDVQFIYSSSGIGISEDNAQKIIFPNPSENLIYLADDIQMPCKYKIFNSSGTILQQGTFQNHINIQTLPKGCYILKIQQNGKLESSYKFIKN